MIQNYCGLLQSNITVNFTLLTVIAKSIAKEAGDMASYLGRASQLS